MFATIEKACVLNGAQAHGYESTFGEVSSYAASAGASQLYSESYVRDNLGRITQRTEVLQGVTTVWGYGYDLSGRLVSVTRNGAPYESYTFDSNDNRLTKTTTAGTTTYAHDDQDRLLSAVGPDGAESWLYDGHGDLVSHNASAGQTSYDYETGGQLLSMTRPDGDVVSYELDAGNKRAVKRVNGVVQRQWVYAGGLLPVAELDASGNLVAVFNGGFMVKNGTTYRLVRDHLGSVRLVVDAGTGTVVQRLSYDAWGNVLEDTNPGFQPFGFAGGLYDPGTGLVRFGARDYAPSVGRWTCKDPLEFLAGLNLYAYCDNDPVNFKDPSGLEKIRLPPSRNHPDGMTVEVLDWPGNWPHKEQQELMKKRYKEAKQLEDVSPWYNCHGYTLRKQFSKSRRKVWLEPSEASRVFSEFYKIYEFGKVTAEPGDIVIFASNSARESGSFVPMHSAEVVESTSQDLIVRSKNGPHGLYEGSLKTAASEYFQGNHLLIAKPR